MSCGELVPIPTKPDESIRILSLIVPLFLVEKAKSAVLFALTEKSSIAIDDICEPETLLAGAKYKLAVLPVVAFVFVI